MRELETINKLFLELSQFATAKTKKEVELEKKIDRTNLTCISCRYEPEYERCQVQDKRLHIEIGYCGQYTIRNTLIIKTDHSEVTVHDCGYWEPKEGG